MNDDSERKRGSAWLRRILVLLGVIVLVLALEGLLSFMYMVSVTGREARPVPTDHHFTDYHGQYGWVAESGVSKRDGYGPWRTLHTDRTARQCWFAKYPERRIQTHCLPWRHCDIWRRSG